jgi:hypothetical protein
LRDAEGKLRDARSLVLARWSTQACPMPWPYDGAMQSIEQLIQSIDGRIRELSGEIAALQDARTVLISNGAAPTTSTAAPIRSVAAPLASRAAPVSSGGTLVPSPVPRGGAERGAPLAAAARRRKPRRKAMVLTVDTAERMLAESDGVTTAELAKQAGADRDQVLKVLRELETARRVRRTGQRRATRWHAFTDEDRIRERAAELASRARR